MDTAWVSRARASDADRERVVRLLQDGLVDGRLSYETFIARLDMALRARDLTALERTLEGLRRKPRRLRLATLVVPWPRLLVRHRPEVRPERRVAPPLDLPDRHQLLVLVGRASDCDVVVADPAVSRRHAALILFDGKWFVLDRESVNGTWLNGRLVHGTAPASPGDDLRLGSVTFRLRRPR